MLSKFCWGIFEYDFYFKKIEKSNSKLGLLVAFVVFGFTLIIFEEDYKDMELYSITLLSYFVLAFLFITRWIFRQIRLVLSLKNEKTKTELIHLQSQVNPHFFFNMLNNLYGWVEKDPKVAKELILNLSDMMRYSIYDGQKDFVTLDEEIAYLKNYVELHKMRYHKKIAISFHTDILDETIQIMPLLFIILLENAFKHGVEKLREGAYVHINLSTNKQQINFSVENNFDSENTKKVSGIGLINLKRRLELVYPKKHNLLLNTTKNIYMAKLTINRK